MPAGAVTGTDAVDLLQFLPPLPGHGPAVIASERSPDDHIAVTSETLGVGRTEAGEHDETTLPRAGALGKQMREPP